MYRHTRIAHAASSKMSLRGRQARRRPPPRPIWRLSRRSVDRDRHRSPRRCHVAQSHASRGPCVSGEGRRAHAGHSSSPQHGPFHVHGCRAHVAEPAMGCRGLLRRDLAGWGLGRDRGDLGTHRGDGLALRIPCMPRRRRKHREFRVTHTRGLPGRRSDLDHAPATHRRSPVRHHPMGRCDAARVATPSLAGSRPDLRLGERARQFVLAFVLLGFAWLEDYAAGRATARRVAIVAAVSAIATLVNPFGIRVWSYVADVVGNPTVSGRVAEWAPPSVRTPIGFVFLFSVLAVFAILATSKPRASWRTVFALAFFALLGMTAIRGVVWWALAFPVLVAPSIQGALERPATRSWLNAVFLVALCALLAISLPVGKGVDPASGGPAVLTFAPENLVAAARKSVPAGHTCSPLRSTDPGRVLGATASGLRGSSDRSLPRPRFERLFQGVGGP